MARLGILFDITALGTGQYRQRAYSILFGALDVRRIPGVLFSDGETPAIHARWAHTFCIAVESADDAPLHIVRDALSRSTAAGLLPLPHRFLEEPALSRTPLVTGASIAANGALIGDRVSWMQQLWHDARRNHPASVAEAEPRSGSGGPAE